MRINPIFALPVVAMALPWIGLIAIHTDIDSYEFILDGTPYTPQPLFMYSVFLATYLITWMFLSLLHALLSSKKNEKNPSRRTSRVGFSLVLVFAAAFLTLSYNVDILGVLGGTVGKSDIRQGSPLIAVIAKYFLPVMFAYACLVYRARRIRLLTLTFVGGITFFSGLVLGAKASAIVVMLPGMIALFLHGLSWRMAMSLGLLAIAGIIVAGLYFDSFLRGGSIFRAADYVAHRAFVLTAEVPYRITERRIGGEEFDYTPTLAAVATNSVLLWYVEPSEIYRYNFARAVSAYLYPHLLDRVNSGRWNHTPTIFAEGVIAFGLSFYWIFAVVAAFLVWNMNRMIRRSVRRDALPTAAVLMGCFIFVLFTWINSGGLATLVHPLPLLTYGCSWFLLKTINKHPITLRGRRRSSQARQLAS